MRWPADFPGWVARGGRQLPSQIDDRPRQNSAYALLALCFADQANWPVFLFETAVETTAPIRDFHPALFPAGNDPAGFNRLGAENFSPGAA